MSARDASAERRQNHALREVLGELVTHARQIARQATTMTPSQLEKAQERLEWLADEVWRIAAGPEPPPE